MKKNVIFILGTFLVTSLIIFSWFSTKTFISNNSEENLDFINFQRTAQHYSSSWYPHGTGYLNVFEYVRYPFLKFLSFFSSTGVDPFLIQAFSFWIIMNLGVIFMYILLYKGFLFKRTVAVTGSYFYLLNIFTMTQVWKRNIYQGMFPWVYLPLFIFLWIKWLDEGKLRWLIIFVISISIFSHAFAHPGYFFVYIATAGIFAIIRFKQSWNNKKIVLRLSLKILLAIFLGILVNFWWLYPLAHNSTAAGSTVDAVSDAWKANLGSLEGVSKFFGTDDILFLRQKFYFAKDSPLSMEWFGFYSNPISFMLSLTVLGIAVLGIIKSRAQKYWLYLVIVLIVGWFISKGTNPPFGKMFYAWLFSSFPVTAALRNSYEKFGLVWLLPYSAFFALGLYHLAEKIKLRWRSVFLAVTLVLFCGILVYPMWNGDIFPQRNRLTIPQYYLEANNYLNLNNSRRVFHIPFSIQTEKLEYSWGYFGEDPSENLFDSQNVSRSSLPIFQDYYKLLPKLVDKTYFPRTLGLLGVDHIILHTDITYPELDSNILKIENWQEINKDQVFGKLTLYNLDQNIVKPEIYTANSLVEFSSTEEALNKISEGGFDVTKNIFTTQKINTSSQLAQPEISFKEVSKNSYQVQVNQAKGPFILVLNHTYNGFWQASVENALINNHFTVNGFANAWLVDRVGDYTVDIVFKMWPWN